MSRPLSDVFAAIAVIASASLAGCGGDEFSAVQQPGASDPISDSATQGDHQLEPPGPDAGEPETLEETGPDLDAVAEVEPDAEADAATDTDAAMVPDAAWDADAAMVPDAAWDADAAMVPDAAWDADAAMVPDAAWDADAAVSLDAAPDVQIVCSSPSVLCGTVCVDTKTSPTNCGTCGNVCPAGTTCTGGNCSCPGSDTLCFGVCVDTTTSNTNCGSCGVTCASGKHCAAGKCM